MWIIKSLSEANLTQPTVVTIGNFDGVHRGHQHLLGHLVDFAEAEGMMPVVLTFEPHPRVVLQGPVPGFSITLPDDKVRLLHQHGAELVVAHPFNDEVRQTPAADFVGDMLTHLNMRSLWIGRDFAMGHNREGTAEFLSQLGREKGFHVNAVDLMDAGSEKVSSSRVRDALEAGDVAEAARLLGRPHFVRGEIVMGHQRGRVIGFPTANFDVPVELAVPARGVYAGWVDLDEGRKPAVINIGLRPTFDGNNLMTVEAHLLDFSGDLYGQNLRLHFTHWLRAEKKFSGVDALVEQISEDVSHARELLNAELVQG